MGYDYMTQGKKNLNPESFATLKFLHGSMLDPDRECILNTTVDHNFLEPH